VEKGEIRHARADRSNVLASMKVRARSVLSCRGCFGALLGGFLLLWIPVNTAQETSKPSHTLSAQQKETMNTFVLDGRYLLEAGKTGESDLIVPLRSYLGSRRADSFSRRQAVMALARLGDQRAQQQIVCACNDDDKIAMQDAAESDLPYVGGWFAIRLYRYLLSPEADKRFWKAKKPEASDLAYVSPAIWALMQLPKIVPNPPVAPFDPGAGDPGRIPQQEGTIWLDWIRQHETLLQQLTPTGEGIDFTGKSCRHFKP